MKHERILLAFSGGTDSTAAARRLIADGWTTEAMTMNMTGSERMLSAAERQAAALGMKFHCRDVREEFGREVTAYFIESYKRGCTPAPCTLCNKRIKWRTLVQTADELGIEHIASGHYFRLERCGGHLYVAAAADKRKDQSYYLWMLDESVLERVITPMADVMKSDLEPIGTRESMGVCFLEGEDYRSFLRRHGVALRTGSVMDSRGRKIGTHDGTAFYTTGQRRGLDVGEGLYVKYIDAGQNRITVARRQELFFHTLYISGCRLTDRDEALSSNDVTVKIRGVGQNPSSSVRISETAEGLRIDTDDAAWAPAKGQPVVLYRGERVIGGGFLTDYA